MPISHPTQKIKKNPAILCGFALLASYISCKAAENTKPMFGNRRIVGAGIAQGIRAQGARVISILLILCVALPGWVTAEPGQPSPTQRYEIDIPALNAADALNELAAQTGATFLFPYELAKTRQANAVAGRYTLMNALRYLLEGSGLSSGLSNKGVLTISEKESEENHNERKEAMNTRKNLLAALVGLFVGAGGQSAMAQDAGDQARKPERKKMVLEEITVTATKRETSLQDTAMSITAVGSEEIARRGLVGMGDYLSSIPGVSVVDMAPGHTAIVMRGMSTDPQVEGEFGPLVGVYIGDTPIAGLSQQGSNPDIKLIDIDRVEVLRGPQGTLYGSSSLGGTVRNIPAAPNLQDFEGNLKIGYSNTEKLGGDNSNLQGVVNLPLIKDELAVRGVAYRYKNSGFYKNIGANDPDIAVGVTTYGAVADERDDVGNDEYVGGRVSVLWQPVNQLSINFMYLHQDIDQSGHWGADLDSGGYLQSGFKMRNLGLSDFGEPEFHDAFGDKINIINTTVEYDLGWATVLSSTSWADDESFEHREIGGLWFGYIPLGRVSERTSDAFTQEVRMASNLDGSLQFIAGLYYEDIDRTLTTAGLFGGDPAQNPFGEQIALWNLDMFYATEQKAVFGEVSYNLTDKIKLTTGARAFDFVKDVNGERGGEKDISYKAGLDYSPNEDTLLYTSWSQGFRLGTPIAPTTLSTCDQDNDGFFDGSNGVSTGARLLESDFVDSYEMGGKFTLLDNRLQINTSIFQNNWDGIPVTVLFDNCGSIISGAKAKSRGVELEGSYYLTDRILFGFGASYINAELSNDISGTAAKGDRLPGSPEYNINFSLQYDFYLAGYQAFLRSDYYYIGEFYNSLGENVSDKNKTDSYGKLNIHVGALLGRIGVEIYANNLTNEDAVTWIESDGLSDFRGIRLRPRTIGVSVSYEF